MKKQLLDSEIFLRNRAIGIDGEANNSRQFEKAKG